MGIHDRRVLAAFGRVPRHLFCLPEHRPLAYQNQVLPLAEGATLSEPFVVAAMLQALRLQGGERVLDVGSGSGFTTALLCELAGAVYAMERLPELLQSSRERIHQLGYQNVRFRCGDGWQGWLEHFPYNAILVSAAAPSIPPAFLDQMAPGGRLIMPVGGQQQWLRLFQAAEDGASLAPQDLFAVRFVPLIREAGS